MSRRNLALVLLLGCLSSSLLLGSTRAEVYRPAAVAQHQRIPTPKDVLGFVPGDDRKLASWNDVIKYFDALAEASDR
ncbi:MAG: hypothetical protein ABR556_13415, partial [Pyrinomonadaceae bacterium]